MKKIQKLILGILIIVLITIICTLIAVKVGNRNIIQKQLEETQKLTATSDENSYITTADHLSEVNASVAKLTAFKKEIASAITEMGVVTAENADADTMASNIRSLSDKFNSLYTPQGSCGINPSITLDHNANFFVISSVSRHSFVSKNVVWFTLYINDVKISSMVIDSMGSELIATGNNDSPATWFFPYELKSGDVIRISNPTYTGIKYAILV